MEVLMMILILSVALVALSAFGGASVLWGVDSRETYKDDHVR